MLHAGLALCQVERPGEALNRPVLLAVGGVFSDKTSLSGPSQDRINGNLAAGSQWLAVGWVLQETLKLPLPEFLPQCRPSDAVVWASKGKPEKHLEPVEA